MKIKFLITIFLILVVALLFVQNSQAQRLISGGKPKITEIDSYRDVYCVKLSNDYRACKGRSLIDESQTHFILQKNKETLCKIDAPFFADSTTENFWAFRGDLDRDGLQEIVISSLEGVSNGMGIFSYNIHIFRDPIKFPGENPFTFPIQEFGEKGNFIFDKRRNETQILITYWRWFDNLDKKRGYGTYLVGKWFRYRNGLLKPVFEKPTLARRFLYSFADERNQTHDNPGAPYLWLKSRNTHKFFTEPEEVSKLVETSYGIIKNYEQDIDLFQKSLFIQTDSGKLLRGLYTFNSFGDKSEENTVYVTDVGLAKQKYTFPLEFDPFLYLEKIEGKRVKLEIYQDQYNHKYTKLWLLDK